MAGKEKISSKICQSNLFFSFLSQKICLILRRHYRREMFQDFIKHLSSACSSGNGYLWTQMEPKKQNLQLKNLHFLIEEVNLQKDQITK